MSEIDRVIEDIGRERPLHRRTLLRLAGALGLTVVGGAVLDACGAGAAPSATPSSAATAGASAAATAASKEPLNVGVLQALTGNLAGAYKPLFIPLKIAVAEINDAGGILGRKINTVVGDDQGQAGSESQTVRSLLDQDIKFIVGPVGSSQSLVAAQALAGKDVVAGPFANDEGPFDVSRYTNTFSFAKTTRQDIGHMVNYLVDQAKIKRIAILSENSAFGQNGTKLATEFLSAKNITPIDVETYDVSAPSQTAFLTKIKNSGADGLMTFSGNVGDANKTFTTLLQLEYTPVVTASSTTIVNVYQVLKGQISVDFLKQIRVPAFRSLCWEPGKPLAARQLAFCNKVKNDPDISAAAYSVAQDPFYDFMYALKHSIEAAGSFEPAKVRKEMENLKDFQGIIGTLNTTPANHIALTEDDVVLGIPNDGTAPESLGFLPRLAT